MNWQCLRWHDVLTDILTEAGDDLLFERLPVDMSLRSEMFRQRVAPVLSRTFSEDAIERIMERYEYFGRLENHKARVVRSIVAPSKATDR